MPDGSAQTALCEKRSAQPNFCALCDVRERSICAEMSDAEIAHVSKTMAHRNISAGQAILSEGEPNESLYVVVDGSFRLTKYLQDGRRQITGFLFKGDFVGVRACAESSYTAEALEDSLVCRFSHKYLDRAAEAAPGIKDRLIARGQTEYHKAQDHIVLLGQKSAEERVRGFLRLVKQATGADGSPEIDLPMPRQDIADYLGLRIETLSRTFAALKKAGVIEEKSRRALIVAGEL